ncbi:unnamed protein product, partial [Staurois parvus]
MAARMQPERRRNDCFYSLCTLTFAAVAVSYRVPAGDYLPAPSDRQVIPTGGRELYVNNTDLSPVSSSTLLC